MNYSLLAEQNDSEISLNPRLIQYLNAVQYHDHYNIKPPIALDKQYSITKHDRYIIREYLKDKQNKKSMKINNNTNRVNFNKTDGLNTSPISIDHPLTKCPGNSCAIYKPNTENNSQFLGSNKPKVKMHQYSYDGEAFGAMRDSHPYMYNNDYIVRQSPYTSNTRTVNRVEVDAKMGKCTRQDSMAPCDERAYGYENCKKLREKVCLNKTIPVGASAVKVDISCSSKSGGCCKRAANIIGSNELDVVYTNQSNVNKDKVSKMYNGSQVDAKIGQRINTVERKRDLDQPIKYASVDFLKRGSDEYNNGPGYFKDGSYLYGDIVDFDTLLRYSEVQDKSKGKIVGKMDTSNKWVDYQNTECRKVPNVERRTFTAVPYKGHGVGMGNVDVESTMWHSEPSRIPGHRDLGGVSINRFEDLFVDIQKNSVYPFDFPRGGVDARDPQLYSNIPPRII